MILRSIKKLRIRYKDFSNHPLTKNESTYALLRYISFNIIQTIKKKPRKYNWINGLKFYAEKGDSSIVSNIYFKLFEYEDSNFLLDHLGENDLFVDVGANVGHFSMLAAGISNAHVIAIEPIPTTFEKLTKNIDLNKLTPNVKCLLKGVAEQEGELNFIADRNAMNRVALEYEKNSVIVEIITLNELLKDKDPKFIKIDVEGYELNVLKGANKVLANPSLKYLMIEFNNSGERYGNKDLEVYNFVRDYSFKPIRYNVEEKKIVMIESFNMDKFNTLFIRD